METCQARADRAVKKLPNLFVRFSTCRLCLSVIIVRLSSITCCRSCLRCARLLIRYFLLNFKLQKTLIILYQQSHRIPTVYRGLDGSFLISFSFCFISLLPLPKNSYFSICFLVPPHPLFYSLLLHISFHSTPL
jgi:hypothetical protein